MALQNKVQQIYEALREEIVIGTLGPGSRIVLQDVADRYHCSTTPAREALRMLQADDLITFRPHIGAVVRGFDHAQVSELYEIRCQLEPYATYTATPVLTAATLRGLAKLVADMAAAMHQEQFAHFGLLNREFHARLYRSAPNKTLAEMVETVVTRSERVRSVLQPEHALFPIAQSYHERILAAVLKRDAERAAEAMREHLLTALRNLKALMPVHDQHARTGKRRRAAV